MPPPSTIPDSEADSSSPSPLTPERPAPSTTAEAVAVGGSRKRSASPDPTSASQESERRQSLAAPDTAGVDSTAGAENVDTKAGAAVAPLSREDREEEKRAKQIAIKARNRELEDEIGVMEGKLDVAKGQLRNKDAAATVKAHIKRLHAYNEIRDVGQGLIGLIAEQRGVRIKECYESGEFGVGAKD